jgi:putative membrane protein
VIAPVLAILYAYGVSRRERWPLRRSAFFGAGLVVLTIALLAPDGSLTGHMVEHVLLMLVAAPLLVLGQPHALAPRRVPRPLRALGSWPVAWGLFAAATLLVHLNELPTNPWLHGLEHAVLLATASLFWFPVLAAPPAPRTLAPVGRIAYLFAAMVPMGVVGALLESTRVYERWSPSAQADAGAAMWVASSIVLVLATVLAAWTAILTEERRQRAREKYEAAP